ncbi:hypothetical protein CO666_11450 [Rhizobium chutanense]|uniref:Uncharacterized protein n=1 Tax=Rhizobium chutanense TaxID=2035448 RepID=A0A2A6JEY7_9HYPH|nr:hypothetical protein CO666_11450 [Rhizobium chutanense]
MGIGSRWLESFKETMHGGRACQIRAIPIAARDIMIVRCEQSDVAGAQLPTSAGFLHPTETLATKALDQKTGRLIACKRPVTPSLRFPANT